MIKLSLEAATDKLAKALAHDEVAAKKAIKATMSDLKRRAPAKVSQAVRERYAIKAGDIPKPGSGRGGGSSTSGATGDTIKEFALVYKGRRMTPTHFGMKRTKGDKRGVYRINATILKGHRVQIGHGGPSWSEGGRYSRPANSPYFMLTGNGGTTIPMQRRGDKLHAQRTVSVPQMVGNDEVSSKAIREIGDIAGERINHNLERYLDR